MSIKMWIRECKEILRGIILAYFDGGVTPAAKGSAWWRTLVLNSENASPGSDRLLFGLPTRLHTTPPFWKCLKWHIEFVTCVKWLLFSDKALINNIRYKKVLQGKSIMYIMYISILQLTHRMSRRKKWHQNRKSTAILIIYNFMPLTPLEIRLSLNHAPLEMQFYHFFSYTPFYCYFPSYIPFFFFFLGKKLFATFLLHATTCRFLAQRRY